MSRLQPTLDLGLKVLYFDGSEDSEARIIAVLTEAAKLYATAGIRLVWDKLERTDLEYAESRLDALETVYRRGQHQVSCFFPRAWSSRSTSDFHGEATTPTAVNGLHGTGGVTIVQEFDGEGAVEWQIFAQELGHYLGLPHLDVVVETGDESPDTPGWWDALLDLLDGDADAEEESTTGETTMPDGRYFADVAFEPFVNDTRSLDTYEKIQTNVMKTGYYGAAAASQYSWTPNQVLRMRLTIATNTSSWAKAIDILDSSAAGIQPLPVVRLSGMAATLVRCIS